MIIFKKVGAGGERSLFLIISNQISIKSCPVFEKKALFYQNGGKWMANDSEVLEYDSKVKK